MIGRLPIIEKKDPSKNDFEHIRVGDVWINYLSGNVFKFAGSVETSRNGVFEGVWVDNNGQVPYDTSVVQKNLFLPKINFNYKSVKKVVGEFGGVSFEDNLPHRHGIIGDDGIVESMWYDTHIELYIEDRLVGRLNKSGKEVLTLMDFEMFNPDGGLPAHNDDAIYPWYKKFERLLGVIELCSVVDEDFNFTFKNRINFNDSIQNIISDRDTFNGFYDVNNKGLISENDFREIKEKYRSYFVAITDQYLSIPEKTKAIYLLGVCVPWDAYDGNVYYIDGNTMYANGNEDPYC
jgi:hypothetical protein